jgi:hypothetical protein
LARRQVKAAAASIRTKKEERRTKKKKRESEKPLRKLEKGEQSHSEGKRADEKHRKYLLGHVACAGLSEQVGLPPPKAGFN